MSQRTLVILLIVSAALNLFVLGAYAGAQLFGGHSHFRGPRPESRGGPPLFAAAAVLPQTDRAAYQEALRAAAQDAGPKIRQARALRHDAWLRLGAEPVNGAAISADLDRARSLETEARGDVDHRIVDFASHLSAAERGQLGQALAQPQRHGPHGRGPGADPPMPVPPIEHDAPRR